MNIWWVRHGPTHQKKMIGWTDAPADLSDRSLIRRLRAFLPADVPILSSDLSRAVTTADALQMGRKRLPHNPGLREIHFGDWEAQSFAAIKAHSPALAFDYWDDPGDHAPPAGKAGMIFAGVSIHQ